MKNLILPISEQDFNHEFRSALTGVICVADLLSFEKLTPHQRDEVSTIRQSGKRLLDFLSHLLKQAEETTNHNLQN